MNAYLRPMQVLLHPAFDLGRVSANGGGSVDHRGFGVMTERAPFESGMCGPNAVVGEDGKCHHVMGMGQTASATPPAVAPTVTPKGRTSIGVTAAVVGLGAAGVQILMGDGLIGKVAFWTEIAALAVLGSVVMGIPSNK